MVHHVRVLATTGIEHVNRVVKVVGDQELYSKARQQKLKWKIKTGV